MLSSLSATNCSANTKNIFGNVSIFNPATNATASVNPLGNLYINAIPHQVSATANASLLNIYEFSPAIVAASIANVFGNVQINVPTTSISVTTVVPLYEYGISEANAFVSVANIYDNIQVTSSITNVTVSTSSINVNPSINASKINIIASTSSIYGYGISQVNANTYASGPLFSYSQEILFLKQILATTNFGIVTIETDSIPSQVLATTNFGSINASISINSASVSAVINALPITAFGVSQANSVVSYNDVKIQENIYLPGVSTITSLGNFVPNTIITASSVFATIGYGGSTYENIQIIAQDAIATSGFGSLKPKTNMIVPSTTIIASATPLSAFGISPANSNISLLGNIVPSTSAVFPATPISVLTTSLSSTISQAFLPQATATTSVGSAISKISVDFPIISGSTSTGLIYQYGISSAIATVIASAPITLIGKTVDVIPAICDISTKSLSSFLIDTNTSITSAVTAVNCGLLVPQTNVIVSSISAMSGATTLNSLINFDIPEIVMLASGKNVEVEIDATSTSVSSTMNIEESVPTLSTPLSQAIASTSAASISNKTNYVVSSISTFTNLGTAITEVDSSVLQVSASISVSSSLASSLFVQELTKVVFSPRSRTSFQIC